MKIQAPVFPESIMEADITWLKCEGDIVKNDEIIGELETDKTTLQIIAPCDGQIKKLYFSNGDKIKSTDVVCDIDSASIISDDSSIDIKGDTVPNIGSVNNTSEIQLKSPTFPESITEGDIKWHKKIGDNVVVDEVIGEIETDKSTIEIISSCNGIIKKYEVNDGDKVASNSIIAVITEVNSAVTSDDKKSSISTVFDSIDTTCKKTDSTKSTIIDETDKKSSKEIKKSPKEIKNSSESIDSKFLINNTFNERKITKVKMTRIRQTISQRLKSAQNTCAMLTTFNEVDMSNIIEMRKMYQDKFVKEHSIKLGFMSLFIKASCYSLQKLPIVNAYIDGNEILYPNYIDISVAVASPKGLVVPVIRDVQKLNFADIEKILASYANDAKSGKLKAEDMDGGTFTISNGGVFGSLMGTPIINPPQSAILGMHAINEKPVVVNGNIVVRPMMYLALTYDHRLIDGREAVTFLRKIKEVIEDPRIVLMDL